MATTIPILPPRPLRLRTSFLLTQSLWGTLLILGGVTALVFLIHWQREDARQIMQDNAIWASGKIASEGNAKGSETSHHFLLNSYELTVDYVDAAGAAHHQKASFESLFTSVDQKSDLVIKYDPKAPDKFALSWAVNLGWSRWAAVVFFVLVLGAMAIGAVFLGLRLFRRLGAARACAEYSEEVELELLEVKQVLHNGRDTGNREYRFRLPALHGAAEFKEVLRKQRLPLFSDSSRRFMIGLCATKGARPTLLRDDFHPFALTEEQKQMAQLNLSQREKALKTA